MDDKKLKAPRLNNQKKNYFLLLSKMLSEAHVLSVNRKQG